MFPISCCFLICQTTSLFFLKTNKQTKTVHNASLCSFARCSRPFLTSVPSIRGGVCTAPGQCTDWHGYLTNAFREAHCSQAMIKIPTDGNEPMLYLLRHRLRSSRTLWLAELAGGVTPCHWPIKPTSSGETVLLFLQLRTWCSGKPF